MLTKVCTKCGVEKGVDSYSKSKKGRYGVASSCKECISEYYKRNSQSVKDRMKMYYRQNREDILIQHREYYQQNKEVIDAKNKVYCQKNQEQLGLKKKQYFKSYYIQNKELLSSKNKQWRQNNSDKCNTYTANYRASKLYATPSWVDKEAISGMYELAALFNRTGITMHVDHTIPLNNENVCGLHCEANLQLLSASDNISKGNRWWPDMW